MRTTSAAAAAATLVVAAACARPAAEPGRPRAAPDNAPVWFVDVAREAGVDVVQTGGDPRADYIIDTIGTGAAWLDYDGDGDADLYLAQGATQSSPDGPADLLLRNDGDADGDGVPRFTDVTEAAGLGDRLWSFGVAPADYDNDGDTDIFLTNWGPDRLYRNDGDGSFTEIAAAAGLADDQWGVSAVWADYDRDGDVDLFVTNYVVFDFDRYPARGQPGRRGEPPCSWRNIEVLCGPRNLEGARDFLFRNDGDPDGDGVPRFTDVTAAAGVLTREPGYGLAAAFFDADNDGDDDLYVANDSVANDYFVNRGNGTFEETALLAGLAYNEAGHDQASMGIAVGDYDGDGLFDLSVTNFSHDHDTLYRNEGMHTFIDVSYPAGLATPSWFKLGWGNAFADIDHDGWEDLLVAEGHTYPQVDEVDAGTSFRQTNSVYRNLGDGRLEDAGGRVGPGLALQKSYRALAPVDLEGDGDLDLLVTSLNDTPCLLRNDGVKPQHWLQVRLVGSRSNRDGIGARVTITAQGRRQMRQITRTASFAASSLPVAHFGLGPAGRVERLEVRWPSGARSLREGLDVDRMIVVSENETGAGG